MAPLHSHSRQMQNVGLGALVALALMVPSVSADPFDAVGGNPDLKGSLSLPDLPEVPPGLLNVVNPNSPILKICVTGITCLSAEPCAGTKQNAQTYVDRSFLVYVELELALGNGIRAGYSSLC